MNSLLVPGVVLLILALTVLTLALLQFQKNTIRVNYLRAGIAVIRHPRAAAAFELNEQKNRKKLLESTVDTGATALELAHRAISSTTFGLIDRFSTSESVRNRARQAQSVHDRSSRQLYRSLKGANRTLHAVAGVMMNQRAERSVQNSSRDTDESPPRKS